MRTLFIMVGLIVVGVVGAGFYFGYLAIGSDNTDGTRHITLTVEQKKMQDDEHKALEKIEGKR